MPALRVQIPQVCFDAVAHPRLRAPKLPARLELPFKQKVEASDEGKARNQMLKAKGLINVHTQSPSVASTSGISLNSVDIYVCPNFDSNFWQFFGKL